MATKRRWQLLAGATAALSSAGFGVHYHFARPPCCPGLPCYDYQFGTVSSPVSAVSQIAVLLERSPPPDLPLPPGVTVAVPPVIRERIKYFELAQARLQIDHCSLSRVALTLHENGLWILSMRADQNPWMTGPRHEVSTPVQLRGAVSAVQPPIPSLARETDGLKRNQFLVRVRCYGAYPLRSLPGAGAGKPVLFELPVPAFWVQRGIPYDFWYQECLPPVRQFFDVIDRVEVELSYR